MQDVFTTPLQLLKRALRLFASPFTITCPLCKCRHHHPIAQPFTGNDTNLVNVSVNVLCTDILGTGVLYGTQINMNTKKFFIKF